MAFISKGSVLNASHVMVVAIVMFSLLGPSMAQSICKGKQSWPELVGVDGKIAKQTIEAENPFVRGVIVDKWTRLIEDFRCNRVWIFVTNDDGTGTVRKVPTVG